MNMQVFFDIVLVQPKNHRIVQVGKDLYYHQDIYYHQDTITPIHPTMFIDQVAQCHISTATVHSSDGDPTTSLCGHWFSAAMPRDNLLLIDTEPMSSFLPAIKLPWSHLVVVTALSSSAKKEGKGTGILWSTDLAAEF